MEQKRGYRKILTRPIYAQYMHQVILKGEENIFSKMSWSKWLSVWKNVNLDLTPYITVLNIKLRTINLLKETMKYLPGLHVSKTA